MAFNYAVEKKKFDKTWETLCKEYAEAGMSSNAIDEIYAFDLKVFNRERAEAVHTQEYLTGDFENEGQSTLLQKFPDCLASVDDNSIFHSRYWWVETIETPKLAKKLKQLSNEDLEILTLYVFENYTQEEIGDLLGTTQQAISKRLKKMKKFYLF